MKQPAAVATIRTLFLVLTFVLAPAASAGSDDSSTPGALIVATPAGELVEMPLEHTAVTIEVSAFVARATIEQTFGNPFREPVEAVYTFPLGDRAAVDDFELVVGERTIRGEIHRREEARQIYEQARSAGYQAALLEQERPNIFTQTVANLEPGKKVRVRIRTVEPVSYDKGFYQLVFPLVVGPRYIPGGRAQRVPDASSITPPVMGPRFRSGHDVDITVSVDAGVPIRALSSPSHRLVTEQPAASTARVRLAPDDTIPNKDFILRWNVAAERPAVGLLAHRDGPDGFFTLLVQPKAEISAVEAAPKEIVVVVDTSGSMHGIPIAAARRFVSKALRELGPKDTFNLIRFAGDNEVYSPKPVENTPAGIERAIEWIGRNQGSGGTEMLAALRAAFALEPDSARVRIVVFVTDGYVGNEAEILGEIGKVLGAARIYTVGIGSSVNHYLLDRMADLGRGSYVFIRPDANADAAVDRFRDWVTKPYLTDLSIDWGALPVADVMPERPRDLSSGQTLQLVGRYLAGSRGEVVVRGKLGGSYWEQRLSISLPDREPRHDALGSVWARNRIEELMLLAPGDAGESVRAAVTSLALEYRLMSPFTSFVAVDDSRVVNAGGKPVTVRQALPLPESVSFEGVFGREGPEALDAKADAPPGEALEAPAQQAVAAKEIYRSVGIIGGVDQEVTGAVPGGVPGGAVGGVFGGVMAPVSNSISADSIEALKVKGVPQPAFVRDLPIRSRIDASAARPRILDAAFRVLADLADDGKLSASEGKPSLAMLLAEQRTSGMVSPDVATHAVATWALAEAAARLPGDPWVERAARNAEEFLAAGGAQDAEGARWARFVLAGLRPAATSTIAAPEGEASPEYLRLRDAIAAAKSGRSSGARTGGGTAFDRLLSSLGRRNLLRLRL